MEKKPINKKKIINIVVNVVVGIICLFILLFAVMAITNTSSGYNKIFGYTILSVKSDSMEGDKPDSFSKGDLIFVKLLNAKEKEDLEKGQIITFWTREITGELTLNSHRIIDKHDTGTGGDRIVEYVTQGDAVLDNNKTESVMANELIGVYSSKWKGVGNVLEFMQGKTGFLIFVVIPAILLAVYCIVIFILNLKGFNQIKKEESDEELKKKLLAELQASGQIPMHVDIDKAAGTSEETSNITDDGATPPSDNPKHTDTVGE